MNYQKWLWEKKGEKCIKNLKKHGFDAHFADTSETAATLIMGMVSDYTTFGFGGSDTTRRLGLPEKLKTLGKTVYDHWDATMSPEENLNCRKQQMTADCFMCSANGISVTGEIVNFDGVGNRTNAMCFGPKKVIIVAGMNKVAKDLDAAIDRVHEIATPMRAKSLGIETPCGKTGICIDCNDAMRLCRITTILHRKPLMTDLSVVLINESIGF
ncbi:MAG: lactate utilization protein [bacterium]